MNRRTNLTNLLLVLTLGLVLGLTGNVWGATHYDGITELIFSPDPAPLSGDGVPDVTVTTTTTAAGAPQPVIDGGAVKIFIATDGSGNAVPLGPGVQWENLSGSGVNPVDGETTLDVDLDAWNCVLGTFVGFRAQYVPGSGGGDKVDQHVGYANLQIGSVAYEGLSHGFWKNCDTAYWTAAGHSRTETLASVFTLPSNFAALGSVTLDGALDFAGGSGALGAARILLRNAVASVLNAAHPNINYPLSLAEVIAKVSVALASEDRDTMLALEAVLDEYNNLGGDIDS